MKYDWKKTLYIVRGLPGSGKSTLAKKLVGLNRVAENDEYWYIQDQNNFLQSTYSYDADMKHIAGWWCWAVAFRKLRVYDEVAVANVFATKKSMMGYIDECRKLEINVKLIHARELTVEESFKSNVHGATMDAIQKMHDSFEKFTQDDCDKLMVELSLNGN